MTTITRTNPRPRTAHTREERSHPAYAAAFARYLTSGDTSELLPDTLRSMHTGGPVQGSYLAPLEFERQVLAALDNYSAMRSVSTIVPTLTGRTTELPTDTDSTSEGAIMGPGERAAVDDADLVVGQHTSSTFLYTSRTVRTSAELIEDTPGEMWQAWIAQALGLRIARRLNRSATIGTGPAEPLGVVHAAALGVTGASGQTSTITGDDLLDLEAALNPAYRPNASYMCSPATATFLKKIKDGSGRYLFNDTTGRVNNFPLIVNPHMQDMSAGVRSVLLGDFRQYRIRDVAGMSLIRLDEAFASAGQVGWILFSRHDAFLPIAGDVTPIVADVNAAS